jgi:adenosylmethionine-8-amino-7-oxononanoate aminotransferase
MEQALEQGVLLRPLGNTLYIMPPYCITAVQLEKVYATIDKLLHR